MVLSQRIVTLAAFILILLSASACNSRDDELELATSLLNEATPMSRAEAVQILAPLAESGDADAQLLVAICFLEGWGVNRSRPEGIRWMRQAAASGHPRAQCAMGSLLVGNGGPRGLAEAVELFVAAADQGDTEAMRHLASMYEAGLGVPKDLGEALRLLLVAADQGDPQAQFLAAERLEQGMGTSADLAEAERWYRLAAEQGHREAKQALKRLGN